MEAQDLIVLAAGIVAIWILIRYLVGDDNAIEKKVIIYCISEIPLDTSPYASDVY